MAIMNAYPNAVPKDLDEFVYWDAATGKVRNVTKKSLDALYNQKGEAAAVLAEHLAAIDHTAFHLHSNKALLDTIAQEIIDNWNAAVAHAESAHFSGSYNDLTDKPGLGDIGDVDLTTIPPQIGETLVWDGTNWVPGEATGGGGGSGIIISSTEPVDPEPNTLWLDISA